ncbi:MAG: ornithine carbamoyltransferase [Candidatus Melainabacteria bacterium GWF2_37_15]|nr:MAG: ornithine carbamoyltransferase [Candidatus Melainabacteria bacterium GWF2_37_15]
MNLKGKDFLTLLDYNKDEILYLIDLAAKLKQENKENKTHHILNGKTLAMIFAKPSLRTRVSFEVGIQQLGGYAVVLKQDEINLGQRETIADTARVLSRYADGIMIRTFAHQDVVDFAKYSDIPVINALTDLCHPCQVLADLLTIKEKLGKLENLKLAYVGDGNNMANSLLAGCSIVGMDVSIACPKGYEPNEAFITPNAEILDDPFEAVKWANIIYTDVWASMGQESEAAERRKIFADYQVNSKLLENASKDAIVLHCLPAHRGEEITESVFETHADIIFEQAENRLHAQKAIMASIM